MLDFFCFLYSAVAIIYAGSLFATWLGANPQDRARILQPDDSMWFLALIIFLAGFLWPLFFYLRFKDSRK